MTKIRQLSGPIESADVVIIDDDVAVGLALSGLLRSVGLHAQCYTQVETFLTNRRAAEPKCLILDVRLPGLGGLDFQATLYSLNLLMPVIVMTGFGDVPMSVRAMKAGAVDFLTKPFRDQEFLDAISVALDQEKRRQNNEEVLSELRQRFSHLTPREREVLVLVTSGLMTKQIAVALERSEITVKIHRSQVIQKMGVRSVAQLTRIAEALGLVPPLSRVTRDLESTPAKRAVIRPVHTVR